jgi:hypothetical protein
LTTRIDNETFTTRSRSGIGTPVLPVMVAGGALTALRGVGPATAKLKARKRAIAGEKTAAATAGDSDLPSVTSVATAPKTDPAPAAEAGAVPSADEIREQLEELRTIIDAWIAEENVPKGTPIAWSNLEHYLVKDSSLEKSHGQDEFGAPYVLGVVGEKTCDLDPSTKARFPDKDASYWEPLTEQ